MAQVFISHSKEDKQGRDFFNRLFVSPGHDHKAYWYSFEGPEPPHAETLLEKIKESASVFVILSKTMEEPHTRSWVGYEVGLAAALKKLVWVFEPSWENVEVPVPYLTGYIQYVKELGKKDTLPYSYLVETAGCSLDVERLLLTPTFRKCTCLYPDCKSSYFRFVFTGEYHCPVCRRTVKLKTKQTNEDPWEEAF